MGGGEEGEGRRWPREGRSRTLDRRVDVVIFASCRCSQKVGVSGCPTLLVRADYCSASNVDRLYVSPNYASRCYRDCSPLIPSSADESGDYHACYPSFRHDLPCCAALHIPCRPCHDVAGNVPHVLHTCAGVVENVLHLPETYVSVAAILLPLPQSRVDVAENDVCRLYLQQTCLICEVILMRTFVASSSCHRAQPLQNLLFVSFSGSPHSLEIDPRP